MSRWITKVNAKEFPCDLVHFHMCVLLLWVKSAQDCHYETDAEENVGEFLYMFIMKTGKTKVHVFICNDIYEDVKNPSCLELDKKF